MEEAFIKGKHHDLSTLQLRIFKALINENYYRHLNEQFGMSKVTFLRHVYELQSLNLLKFDEEVDHVFIIDEYQMNFHAKLIARDSLYSFAKFGSDTINVLKTDTNRLKSLLFRSPFQSIHWERISGFEKGDIVKKIDGVVRFVKTENGWEIYK